MTDSAEKEATARVLLLAVSARHNAFAGIAILDLAITILGILPDELIMVAKNIQQVSQEGCVKQSFRIYRRQKSSSSSLTSYLHLKRKSSR